MSTFDGIAVQSKDNGQWMTQWAGEFHATIGDGTLSEFLLNLLRNTNHAYRPWAWRVIVVDSKANHSQIYSVAQAIAGRM